MAPATHDRGGILSEMPSKKSARKLREKKEEVEWRAFTDALEQFKRDGTGSCVDGELLAQFPLFHGTAPPGHPYPQAFTEGATGTNAQDQRAGRLLHRDLR